MFQNYKSNDVMLTTYHKHVGFFPTWTGMMKALPTYCCKTRIMEDYFIIYIAEGKGIFRCLDREYVIKAGDAFFLFPGIAHSYYTDEIDLLLLWWIGFNGSSVGTLLKELDITPETPIVTQTQNTRISDIIIDTINASSLPHADLLCLSGNLNFLFSKLASLKDFQAQEEKSSKFESRLIRQAKFYIESNYSQPLSVVEIANSIHLSRTHFTVKFKKETGTSPKEFLENIRLEKAKYYLKSTNSLIKEIANWVGFEDSHYFSRLFKKKVGLSPGEFRLM